MRVESTVKFNMGKIRQLSKASITALEQTAEALHTEVVQAQVIPRDTGLLQGEATFVDTKDSHSGKVSIISSTPYARRLYFHPEYHFQKTENPNAKGEWWEDWIPGGAEEDFCQKTFAKLYKRLAGV